MASINQQFLAYVLLRSHRVGSVATSKIHSAISISGHTDHEVGASLLAGKYLDVINLFGQHAEAVRSALRTPIISDFESLLSRGEFIVCPFDSTLPPHYWERAKAYGLPLNLVAKGNAPSTARQWVAVIGSRAASAAGLRRAEDAGAYNAESGHVTVSGGARGIDTTAISAASRASGMTVIVPAGDVSCVHGKDVQFIVSPFAPGISFSPGLAMARNKVVIGLANSVIVCEVRSGIDGSKSGTQDAMAVAEKFGVPVSSESNP